MEEAKKQTAKQRYYQKNKELYKERVRLQREEKKANPLPPLIQNTPILEEINDSPIQNLTNTKRIFIKVPYLDIDFLIWTKRMTYVTIDIRDTTGEFVWNGINQVIKEKNIPIQNLSKTDHTIEINTHIDSIKRFLKVGEQYVIEIPSARLDIPVFFNIKQINKDNIIVDYFKIDFLKIGTGESTIAPIWDEMKDERIIHNKDIVNIYPFDEKKKYRYDSYCYIRNDVREFYGIVNKYNR